MNETLIPTDGGTLVVSHSITLGDINDYSSYVHFVCYDL